MFNRVKQFFHAVTAKVSFADALYVREMLDISETVLFFAMSVEDQRHAIDVAHTVERLYDKMRAEKKEKIDVELLVKAALLHDIGRVKGDMKIYQKALCVLLDKWDPKYARSLTKPKGEKGTLSHAVFVYYNHPGIGAEKLEAINEDPRMVYLVGRHHSNKKDKESELYKELVLLKKADGMN